MKDTFFIYWHATVVPVCGTIPVRFLDLSMSCIACAVFFSPEENEPAIVLAFSHCSHSTAPQLVAEEATNVRNPPGLLTVPVDNETGPPKDTKNSASANIFAPLLVDTFTPFLTSSVDAAVFEVCPEVVRKKKKKESHQPPLHHPPTTTNPAKTPHLPPSTLQQPRHCFDWPTTPPSPTTWKLLPIFVDESAWISRSTW